MGMEFQFIEVKNAMDPNWAAMLPVLGQLREGLTQERLSGILESARGQGPRFTGLFIGEDCVSVAGWRLMANTHLGLVLYIDDLVVEQSQRSRGYGHHMLKEMERIASDSGAKAIDLDSGVQRSDAHRFYFANGYSISSHHFCHMIG
jgi:GNAT superfamily N-acetyltransferase